MPITYDIEWLVLDDTAEGPLTWVDLGIANSNAEVIGYGGDISCADIYDNRISSVRIFLNKEYHAGETARFNVEIRQDDMLCANVSDSSMPFYEFTPGWFDDIAVESYRFSWAVSDGILSDNSDSRTDTQLLWTGALDKGERRTMRIYYDINSIADLRTVQYKPSFGRNSYSDSASSDKSKSGMDLFSTIICIGFVYVAALFMMLLTKSLKKSGASYNGGRGFGVSRPHIHIGGGSHRGGGCACACAGCACACACAGGGRAGCSAARSRITIPLTPRLPMRILQYLSAAEKAKLPTVTSDHPTQRHISFPFG